jgi:GT2 family glycosyltransferase
MGSLMPPSEQAAVAANRHPVASVILCVRNGAAMLERQLAALAEQDFLDWELLVVDNGSTDDSVSIARRWAGRFPALRIVDASARAGLSYARNAGAAAARGSVLAFCDADDAVSPGWLAALVRCAGDSDLVCGHLRISRLNSPVSQYWRGMSAADREFPEALGYLHYAVGANFAIRKEVYEAIGGCDERFPICGDDIDLSWRVQQAGRTITSCPEAIVDYQLREGLKDMARQRFLYGQAEALLIRKHPGARRATLRERWPTYWYLGSRVFHLLLDSRRRGGWIAAASYTAGRISGGIRQRMIYY